MPQESPADNSGSEIPLEFELSEAPIHRIQALATVFYESIERIEGFKNTQSAVFVRRDFDSRNSSKSKIVFNATFYRSDVVTKFKGFKAEKLELDDLLKLRDAGLNSARTERRALDRSVDTIQRWNLEQSKPEGVQLTHSWLELYSRAAYKGGLPGFVVDQYSGTKKLPPIILCEAKLTKKGDTPDKCEYEDTIWQEAQEEAVYAAGAQLPLKLIKADGQKTDTETGLYNLIQKRIDPSSDISDLKEGSKSYIYVLPVYDYSHVQKDSNQVLPWGALLGLLLLPLQHNGKVPIREFELAKQNLYHISPHLNRFAWGFLRAEFNEILNEDYSGDDPLKFIEKHAGRVDGWDFSILHYAPSDLVKGFKDGAGHKGIDINLEPDLFSPAENPPAIKLEFSDPWTRDDNQDAEKEAERNIARRIRHFYEQATLQHAKKMAGRKAELKRQMQAASHELKDLTGAIAKANGKPYMLKIISECFLDFSLPVTGLNENKHRHDISPHMFGEIENAEGTHGIKFDNLYDWMESLVCVASGVQAMATACKKKVPESDEEIKNWQNYIQSYFRIDKSLKHYIVPTNWEAKCLFSAAVLCIVRNIIKHTFDFDLAEPEFEDYRWEYKWRKQEFITVTCDIDWLIFKNPCNTSDEDIGSNGTFGSVEYYLQKMFEEIDIKDDPPAFHRFTEQSHFVSKIPLISRFTK